VQLSSGLLKTATNALIGAKAFLTASNVLVNSVGTSLTSTTSLTLQPGDVLYVETTPSGTTTTTGSYRRYNGSSAWSGTASTLRTALTTLSTNWLADAGPLMQLIRPGTSTTDYRLQSGTLGTPTLNNANFHTLGLQTLSFVVETPTIVFDPSTSVSSANNILTLTNLGAATGDIISYHVDPTFKDTVTQAGYL